MKPFLYQVASVFYRQYDAHISRLAFVFPNKRAGLFFKKYLSEIADKPIFSPTILTITDLFIKLSGKQPADRIHMLFTLYKLYVEKSRSLETFDEFLYWGEMLLNDFDDVDKYLVDAGMMFTNVTDFREIDTDYSFLNPKQMAAIRTFWSSFNPGNPTSMQESFLAAWEILFELYRDFKDSLQKQGIGYEGMIYREVVENFSSGELIPLPYDKVVFVGLNALSPAEESLLTLFQAKGIGDFYWDYISDKVCDEDNKASLFVEKNLKQFPSQLGWLGEEPVETQVDVIGIPSGIGQAKQLYALLEDLCGEHGIAEETAIRTAIVLPDETLLIPVLNAIPEPIRKINVTMGYPLAGTPVASLMEYILILQKNIRYMDRQPMFHYRDVLPILNHRYILAAQPEIVTRLIKYITDYNKIYISSKELEKNTLLRTIFTPVSDAMNFSEYLLRVLQELNHYFAVSEEEIDDEENSHWSMSDLEQEFIFHYFATVNRMREVMKDGGIEMQFEIYFRLLKRITDTIKIPFEGEPLGGLQVMGVLETRALDFDRLIILSMNEGKFPSRNVQNSFIPYNLRRGFGLPTSEHQDAIWAYHFYRLIHRSSRVSLLYDTRNTGLNTGEKSRYIHQLHYHYQLPLINKLVVYNVSSSKTSAICIHKTPEIMERMQIFLKGQPRAISASAINTYLDCPLKFYFSVIENVQEEEQVTETIESSVFGSILHKVMEELYEPLRGKIVTADLLVAIGKDTHALTTAISRAFAEVFFKTNVIRPLTGQNYLIGEMIRKYVEKTIERDRKLTPFRYLESERRIIDSFILSDGREIQLKGFIDRIDEVDGIIRIIDYKSGTGNTVFNSIASLFDMKEKERCKAVMQVFMYAWMYQRLPEGRNKMIRPGIYYMRELFSQEFDPNIYYRLERNNKVMVSSFGDYVLDYEIGMRSCLDKIFHGETPFVQTPTGKACVYCDFKEVCGH
ncbi:MAG: PD-(D/E)XK nuclease family protein [Tannerellaceae bacterium]|nr:PD-(D/E)XK nuclease family protein [Tannerellaceae bacterium]